MREDRPRGGRRRASGWVCAVAQVAVLVTGSASCGPDTDADTCEPVVVFRRTLVGPPGFALLLVMDGSETMAEEQAAIAERLPAFVASLARGDGDGDGLRDFDGVERIHLGVVTTSMGTAGYDVPGCGDSEHGDDGILRTVGDTSAPGCTDSYPSFLSFDRFDDDDPEAVGRDFACVARVGTSECSYPQPLEAALKAVTSSASGVSFRGGTRGHADRANEGFLPHDYRLAVVVVTDRDDCSVLDPRVFDSSSSYYDGDVATRCARHPGALHPVDRYAELPERVLFAVVAGVPPELVADPLAVDHDAVLAAPEMQQVPDPAGPGGLRASCHVPDRGAATPPRRLVEAARAVTQTGGQSLLASICEPDLNRLLEALRERIGLAYGEGCMTPPLVREASGLVDCDLIEVLAAQGEADRTRCDEIPGRERIGALLSDSGRSNELCVVRQLPVIDGVPTPGDGWYYDDVSAEARYACRTGRFTYSRGAYLARGSTYFVECGPAAIPTQLAEGSPCPSPSASCARGDTLGDGYCMDDLACDRRTGTMRVPCSAREESGGCPCDSAGLCALSSCRTVPRP